MALKMRLPANHNDTQERFARTAREGGYLEGEGPSSGKPSALDRCLLIVGVVLSAMVSIGLLVRLYQSVV